MPESDRNEKLNQELQMLRAKVRDIPSDTLERDLAEADFEIQFLESQVKADLGSYTPNELSDAHGKISHFKQRAEILKIEMKRRNSK